MRRKGRCNVRLQGGALVCSSERERRGEYSNNREREENIVIIERACIVNVMKCYSLYHRRRHHLYLPYYYHYHITNV